MAEMKPQGKVFLLVLVVAALFGGGYYLKQRGALDKIAPKKASPAQNAIAQVPSSTKDVQFTKVDEPDNFVLKVCVNTWGGFAGGEYYNGGFAASEESRYWKNNRLKVQFVLIDDFDNARAAWKRGDVDLLWQTADAFCNEASSMASFGPKVIFQPDWSRGGDAFVGTRDVKSVEDLRGRSIALALGTPSHSLLLWSLKSSGIGYNDVKIVECKTAIDAAALFKAGKVDAAVVWSPDDQDCLAAVTGSHILTSTKVADNIIADTFYAKDAFIAQHRAALKALIEGWFLGAEEINASPQALEAATQILAAGLNQPADFCRTAILNTRLCTYGDNVNFFNINGTYPGVKGEDLYTKTGMLYAEIGYLRDQPPSWRMVMDSSILRELGATLGNRPGQAAEATVQFAKATPQEAQAPAFATKRLTVNFPTNSSTLDVAAQSLIDREFRDVAKQFRRNRIRIEGNTDNRGSQDLNVRLSRQRAQSVADYLVRTYGFDANRFIIVGNGWDQPIADNDTEAGRARNRRTDFELVSATY